MDKVAEVALAEYRDKQFDLIPLFPAVLVRVLPKPNATASGLIVLLDTKYHNHSECREAIVIRPYEPKTIQHNGKELVVSSGLTAGDHVVFPQWSGEPVAGLNDEEYRLVPCKGPIGSIGNREAGEIFGILAQHKAVEKEVADFLEKNYPADPHANHKMIARVFLELYEVIAKIKSPMLKK